MRVKRASLCGSCGSFIDDKLICIEDYGSGLISNEIEPFLSTTMGSHILLPKTGISAMQKRRAGLRCDMKAPPLWRMKP